MTPHPDRLTRSSHFVATGPTQLHYDTSGLLVHFLLEGAQQRYAEGFREFLAAVARGEPATAERPREDRMTSHPKSGSGIWLSAPERHSCRERKQEAKQ